MRAVSQDSARIFFGASRRVSSPSSGIRFSIRSPWTGSAVRLCGAFLTKFSTSRLPMSSLFTRSFTAPKTRKSGGRASATVRKELPNLKSAAGKPPDSLLSVMTYRNSNPRLAFHALPRPEAASAHSFCKKSMQSRKDTAWKKSRKFGDVKGGRMRPKLADNIFTRAHSLQRPSGGDELPIFITDNPSRDYFFPIGVDDVRRELAHLPQKDWREITHIWFRRFNSTVLLF